MRPINHARGFSTMRVKAGAIYTYNASGIDRWDPKCQIQDGSKVRVVNLPSAPRTNTMGQCYVADILHGLFIGMVSTDSLSR